LIGLLSFYNSIRAGVENYFFFIFFFRFILNLFGRGTYR